MIKYTLKIFLIIFSFASVEVLSQTFSISGYVTDTAGKPIPGVNIIIRETKTGAASDQDGFYIIKNLTPASYTVEFSAIGFKKFRRVGIRLTDHFTLNVTLEESIIQTEQVIVTAAKHEQNISDLPVSAEVVGSDLISKKNITNLEQALRYVPGINLTDDQISIRGSSGYSRGVGSRVLLAVDGIPFYTGDTGETIWEVIPVTEIERVEIIKGAASSLYGSTAIGGVINVLTRPIREKPVTYIKSLGGFYAKPSFNEWDWSDRTRFFNALTLAHSNKTGDFGFSASFTRLETDGYRQNSFNKKYIGFFKGVYDFSPTSSISLLVNTLNKRGGSFIYWKDSRNALVPPDEDQGQRIATNRYLFGAIYKNLISDDLLLNLKVSYYRTNWEESSIPKIESTSDLIRGEIQTDWSVSEKFLLISGIEGIASGVTSTIFGNPRAVSSGAYAHGEVTFNFPLLLSFGARFDYSKIDTLDGSGAFSPKVGLNYKLTDEFIFRSSFGTGFRAPSLAEAFTSTTFSGITVKPNPKLKSERNFTFEAGFNYKPLQEVNFDLSVFQNEYYDFIEASIDPTDGLVVFDNVTRARVQGFEYQNKFYLFYASLILNNGYTYLWSRDIEKNKALKYRPRHLFYGSVDYNLNKLISLGEDFIIGGDFRFWSRVEEIDNELAQFVKDAHLRVPVYVIDLRASLRTPVFEIPARISVAANNVLNYNYIELIGNLAPVTNFSLSIEFYLQ